MLYTNSQVKKEIKKRNNQIRKEARQQLEANTKRREKMFFLMLDEEKRDQARKERERKEYFDNAYQLLERKNDLSLSYQEYLTIRDVLFYDYVQVRSDLNKNKITLRQIENIITIINNHGFNINKDLIVY